MVDYSSYQHLLVEKKDGIALLTMNRPEVLNATNARLHNELSRIWLDLGQDPEVRVPARCDAMNDLDPEFEDGVYNNNGGISGVLFYATTRAEDDPRFAAGEEWEPGIPNVQVALYRDVWCASNGGPAFFPLCPESTPGEFVLAQADTAANAEAVGIVESVAGSSFEVIYQGRVDLQGVAWTDLPFVTIGEVWFLSETVAGELTRTPPTTAGSVIK